MTNYGQTYPISIIPTNFDKIYQALNTWHTLSSKDKIGLIWFLKVQYCLLWPSMTNHDQIFLSIISSEQLWKGMTDLVISVTLCQIRTKVSQIIYNDTICPMMVKYDQLCPNIHQFYQFWSTLSKCIKFGIIWHNIPSMDKHGIIWSGLMVRLGQLLSMLINYDQEYHAWSSLSQYYQLLISLKSFSDFAICSTLYQVKTKES